MSLKSFSECAHVFGNGSTATIAVLAATPGRRVCIYRFILTNAAAATVTLQDTSGAALSQQFQLPTGTMPTIMETQQNGDPIWSTAAGLGIQLAQGGTVNIGYDMWVQILP